MAYDYTGALQAGADPQSVATYLANKQGYDLKGAISAGANVNDVIKYLSNKQDAIPTPAPTPDTVKPGMLASIGGAIINAPERLGGTIAQGIHDMTGIGNNLYDQNNQAQGLFGNKLDLLGTNNGQVLNNTDTAKDITGNVLQNASLMIPGSAELKGLGTGAKILEGAKTGAITGGLYGTGSGLSDQKSIIDSGISGAEGAVSGAFLGGVIPGVTGAMGGMKDYAGNIINKDVQTLRSEKITEGLLEQNSRLKTAQKAFDNNTVTRTLDDGTKSTISPIDTISKYNLTPEVKSGTLNTGHNINHADDIIDTLDTNITDKLKNTGKTISIDDLRVEAEQAAKSNSILQESGKVKQTIDQVNRRIDDFKMTYGDNIPVETINKIRIRANKDYSPETADASLVMGDVGRKIVYGATGDKTVKTMLQEQGNLLLAKKYLSVINGTKVSHGTLGKYFLRTAGAVIGSTIDKTPVVGPLVGALGGEAVARGLQQTQFKSIGTEAKALFSKKSAVK